MKREDISEAIDRLFAEVDKETGNTKDEPITDVFITGRSDNVIYVDFTGA